jgi:DNA repair exonuclease SbcCD ATPase subunit
MSLLMKEPEVIAVSEDPTVKKLTEAVKAVTKELADVREKERHLQEIINPPQRSSDQRVSPILPEEISAAEADFSGVRTQRQRLESKFHPLNRELADARERAKSAVDIVRGKQRKALVAEVFEKLREAETAAQRLAEFDEVTTGMGGSACPPPAPYLISGQVEGQYDLAQKEKYL